VICERLFNELIEEEQPRYALMGRCNLTSVFWEQVERHYAYLSDTPSAKDFSIELFKSCYALSITKPKPQDKASLNNDALVLFKRWKESRKHEAVFEALSEENAKLLDIESDLNTRDLRDVIDYYPLIDQEVIVDLVKAAEQRTLSEGEITKYYRERRQSHWYADFKTLYTAIEVASQFLARLDRVQVNAPLN
jgi:sulfur transfer complex TusBCD TusB component (DsrH family)